MPAVTTTTIPRGAVTITRRQAHDADACVDDTRRVLNYLRRRDGRIPRKDQRISLQDVADVLGVDGVVWCLAARGESRVLRMFAVRCARRALRRAGARDPRLWRAVRVAQWHAHGWATEDDVRDAARAAAWAAAWGAARGVAGYAARDAALAAAHAASQDDVRDTAWAAAWAVAWAVARASSQDDAQAADRAAARAAELEAQMHLLLSMSGYGGQA